MSGVENQAAPATASRQSSVRGRGKASFLVTAFSLRLSIQGWTLPSFLGTRTMGNAKGEVEGLTVLHALVHLCALFGGHIHGWFLCYQS